VLVWLATTPVAWAAASYTLPYQTTLRETSGGVATVYRGDAYFKFVLYRRESSAAPRVPIWSHDPDYLASLDPGRPVEVPEPVRLLRVGVPDGVASVYLGGTDGVLLEADGSVSTVPIGPGQTGPMLMSPLDAGAFAGGAVYVRVWLGKGIASFEALAPDLPLAASPFALRAAVAESVAAKGVTFGALSDDLNGLLGRVAALSEQAEDADLLAQGFRPVRRLPAAPYERVGRVSPPTGRVNHVAAWTGTELLVFGGTPVAKGEPLAGGVRYRPASDAWGPLPTTDAPSARQGAVSAWTGDRWLVWGGVGAGGLLADGASLDPVANRWSALPSAPPAFIGRRDHAAVWTGTHWLIWGGLSMDGPMADGAAYDPAARSWQTLPACPGPARYGHSAVWTGGRMVIWGGRTLETGPLGDGYEFEPGTRPVTGVWRAVAASPLSPRHSHGAFWTSSGMVVWGGVDGVGKSLGDGALWGPPGGLWRALPEATGFLVPASGVQGAWTSVGLYLFGGATDSGASGAGAYLDVNRLVWLPTPRPGPAARFGHTVVPASPADDVLIFGGADSSVAGAFQDLWRLSAEQTQYLYRKP
jgi:hypothetical protein